MSKKKHAVPHGMRNLCGLKVRHYTARLIEIIEYLDLFSGEELTDKIGVTELKAFFLIVCPIVGSSKHMYRDLIVDMLRFKSMLKYFNAWR